GDRERTGHAPTPEAGKSVADSARPHVVGSQVTHRASRITHPGLLLLICTLASCGASSDGVIALEGATLIDGSEGEPIKDALVLVQHGHIQAVARVNENRVRRAVDLRAVAGTDHVKIYTKFTADLLRPLLDEATTLRLPVAAHLGKIDALTAARAGVASLEHMAGVVAAASRDPTPYFRAHD